VTTAEAFRTVEMLMAEMTGCAIVLARLVTGGRGDRTDARMLAETIEEKYARLEEIWDTARRTS
jgi:hypothetical protein